MVVPAVGISMYWFTIVDWYWGRLWISLYTGGGCEGEGGGKDGGGGGEDEGGEVDSGGGSGGGVGDAEDRSEVEIGMGAESFSSTAYSGTCDSGKTVNHSIKYHFPNNYNYY